MPTLKEILAERKRKAAQSAQEVSNDTQIHEAESCVLQYTFQEPLTEWQKLFEGCTEF